MSLNHNLRLIHFIQNDTLDFPFPLNENLSILRQIPEGALEGELSTLSTEGWLSEFQSHKRATNGRPFQSCKRATNGRPLHTFHSNNSKLQSRKKATNGRHYTRSTQTTANSNHANGRPPVATLKFS